MKVTTADDIIFPCHLLCFGQLKHICINTQHISNSADNNKITPLIKKKYAGICGSL